MQKCNKSLVLTTLITLFSSICIYSQNLIVNGDFGTFDATIFSPPPLGYTTTYTQMAYNDTNASSTGKYSITNNPSALAPGVLSSFFDNTTNNGTGNMMYVDGRNNQVFWKQDSPATQTFCVPLKVPALGAAVTIALRVDGTFAHPPVPVMV